MKQEPYQIGLAPCPFCGFDSPTMRVYRGKDGWRDRYAVICRYDEGGCGAEGGMYHSAIEAAEAWNRRAEGLTMNLIERDAVKRELNAQYAVAKSTENPDAVEQVLREVSKAVDSLPSVNRWIPCSERLPEVYEKVLTYNDEGIIHDNFRLNLRDGSVGWSQGWGITHWQPRPEPPEKEEKP